MNTAKFGIRSVTMAAIAVALLSVACGSSSPSSSSPSGSGGQSATPASASATIQQGAGGQLVFSPATLTVKHGDTIEVKNVSSIPHTFTVKGQEIDLTNEGGQTQTVTVSLAPGTYTFICRFHVNAGMQGSLTVTG
jgi:plastocyanin